MVSQFAAWTAPAAMPRSGVEVEEDVVFATPALADEPIAQSSLWPEWLMSIEECLLNPG